TVRAGRVARVSCASSVRVCEILWDDKCPYSVVYVCIYICIGECVSLCHIVKYLTSQRERCVQSSSRRQSTSGEKAASVNDRLRYSLRMVLEMKVIPLGGV
uniref:Uncharacterized protein n=1 Tax=Anopheles dirus TaxID=7168 RepID=A0A182NW48_9DIPT